MDEVKPPGPAVMHLKIAVETPVECRERRPATRRYRGAVDGREAPTAVGPPNVVAAPPRYIDALIGDFAAGAAGRFNHLGHWSDLDADPLTVSREQAQLHMVEILAELAGITDGATVVDVGSGFGGTIEALDERFADVTLVGLDVDGRQLARCRTLAPTPPNRLAWIQGDGCALPLVDRSVDHLLSIEAMWHFPSRASFLAEAARVLRPGGAMAVVDLLVDPEAAAQMGLGEAELTARLQEAFAPWPSPQLTVKELVATAARVGLVCAEVIDATEHTKPTYLDHGDSAVRPGASSFSSSRSVQLFVELHQRNLLHVLYLRFEHAASAGARHG